MLSRFDGVALIWAKLRNPSVYRDVEGKLQQVYSEVDS
jgi:hypothetical protein